MMDEKRLDELEKRERMTLEFGANAQELRSKEVLELIRLARLGLALNGLDFKDIKDLKRLAKLGLWAEKHGISALDDISEKDDEGHTLEQQRVQDMRWAKAALAALPKDTR